MIKKIAFCQLGRRGHYGYAQILYKENILGSLYTDFWYPFYGFNPKFKFLDKIVSRKNIEIPNSIVKSYNFFGIELSHKIGKAKSIFELSEVLARYSKKFGLKVIKEIKEDIVIGYSSECLEIFEFYKSINKCCVLIQYDAGNDEFIFENEKFNYETFGDSLFKRSKLYYDRIYKEWQLADKIIVNSNWTKKCIINQGAIESKIIVFPLVFESKVTNYTKTNFNNKKLKVLFVGSIVLRKGIQYLNEAAKILSENEYEFHAFGSSLIPHSTLQEQNPRISFHPFVSQMELKKIYMQFDVLVFPSLSDGFGSVQLEAMSYGLPVIATSACGDAVIDGVNGFVVEPKDINGIVNSLETLNSDRKLLAEMSANASKRVNEFSITNQAFNFTNIFSDL
jgi:glycosyltransferase involved in cell wall biosynthesis